MAFEPTTGRAGSLLVNVPAMIALQRSYLAQLRNDAAGTAAFAEEAMARLGHGDEVSGVAIEGFFGVAHWLRGRLAEAEQVFVSNTSKWRDAGHLSGAAWAAYSLARLQRAQGRLDAAVETCRQALEFATVPGRPATPAAGPALVGLAEMAYQRNELDAALQQVSEGIALCRMFVYRPPLDTGLVTLAWIRHVHGDPDSSLEAMADAEPFFVGLPSLVHQSAWVHRARLRLAQGDVAGTARWTDSCGLDADDDPDYPREPGHLVLARLLLAQGRPGRALALLDRLLSAAVAEHRTASVIEIQALRAFGLDAGGDETGAIAALGEALVLACPQGYVRIFADEGLPMADLLGRLVAAQRVERTATVVPLGCLARLQQAFSPATADSSNRKRVTPGLVEQLTSREVEVLECWPPGDPTGLSPPNWWSASTPSKSTSATF